MNLEKILLDFGLTQKQAKIYLACLELGSASVYKISKIADLPRSTCYEILDILKQKGLVSTFHKKKIKYYNASDPQNIIKQEKEKIAVLEQSLPQFNAIYGSAQNKPKVRFYQGKTGMKIILEEILEETKEILAFNSTDDLFAIMGDYWEDFIRRRTKKRIPSRVIMRDSEKARERKRLGPSQLRTVRIIPSHYEHGGLTFIWKNKTAFFSFKKEMEALVIESQEIAKVHKAMFEFMWDTLEK